MCKQHIHDRCCENNQIYYTNGKNIWKEKRKNVIKQKLVLQNLWDKRDIA